MHWVKVKSGDKNCLWAVPELDLVERDLKAHIIDMVK